MNFVGICGSARPIPWSHSLIPVLTPHGSLGPDQVEGKYSLEDEVAGRLEKYFTRGSATAFGNSALGRLEAACHRLSHGGVISHAS